MSQAYATDWFRDLLWRAIMIAGPPISAIVVVGLIMAIIQATTSVNDQAVAFGPKGLAGATAIALTGPWMLQQLIEFTSAAFTALQHVAP